MTPQLPVDIHACAETGPSRSVVEARRRRGSNSPRHRDQRLSTRGAFSLIELVTSLVIMSVLLAAMGSAILLATRAIPTGQSTPETIVEAGRALRQISEELQTAIYLDTASTNEVAFTVADRNGDGVVEVIRYAWTGTAGDPLTRQYNDSTAVTLLSDVHSFTLNFTQDAATELYSAPLVESAEQVFLQQDDTNSGTAATFDVTATSEVAQYFSPTLPVDAVGWRISRVQFLGQVRMPNNGRISVEVRPAAAGGEPSTTIIDSVLVNEGNVIDGLWHEVAFSSAAGLDPYAGYFVNWMYDSGHTTALRLEIGDASTGSPGTAYYENSTSSWVLDASKDVWLWVWGTVTTPAPTPKTVTRQHVSRVGVSIQVGSDADRSVDTSVATYNLPQILTAYWELDFDADPRIVDANGDATGDWIEWSGSSGVIDTADLVDGVWHSPNATLPNYTAPHTVPDNSFTELTTIEARYRSTSVGGWGASVYVNADRAGSQCAPLCAVLQKPDASTQQLWIGNRLSTGAWQWFATLDVPDDFVNVRLVIDPADDTIAAFVDGVHRGTYTYTVGWVDNDAVVWVYSDGCTAEFEHVRIAVGGSSP